MVVSEGRRNPSKKGQGGLQLREQELVSSAGMLHQQAMLKEQQLFAHQQHFVEWQKIQFAEAWKKAKDSKPVQLKELG